MGGAERVGPGEAGLCNRRGPRGARILAGRAGATPRHTHKHNQKLNHKAQAHTEHRHQYRRQPTTKAQKTQVSMRTADQVRPQPPQKPAPQAPPPPHRKSSRTYRLGARPDMSTMEGEE